MVAFVVLEDSASEEEALAAIIKFTEESFEEFERPVEYIIKDKLPLTTIGKVDYRALENEAGNY